MKHTGMQRDLVRGQHLFGKAEAFGLVEVLRGGGATEGAALPTMARPGRCASNRRP